MKTGYYFVKLKSSGDKTIGKYTKGAIYPWEVIASDEIFKEEQIEVIKKIDV